jgi:uracil-DNA glycosylase family 4
LRRDVGTSDTVAFQVMQAGRRQLAQIALEVTACTRCERLVAWREQVAASAPRSHAGETYWARPLPGFGDCGARLVVVGLAPAAHGGNRTGRMFTGDRSGDFLIAGLHRAGYASQRESVAADDGLSLTGAYVTAAVRCAPPDNKPTPGERAACAPYLTAELGALGEARVLLALGAIAYDALRRMPALVPVATGPTPRFGHGAEVPLADGRTILCSYHPSQRNVFTGLLTAEMFEAVLGRARALGG